MGSDICSPTPKFFKLYYQPAHPEQPAPKGYGGYDELGYLVLFSHIFFNLHTSNIHHKRRFVKPYNGMGIF